MKLRWLSAVAVMVLSVGVATSMAPAHATVVYGNIASSADISDSVTARPVGNLNISNPNAKYAQGFTSGTSNLVVQSITVGLGADTPITSAQVQIFSSALVSGTAMPNVSVASFSLTGTSSILDQQPYVYTGSFTLSPSTPYWLVVSDGSGNSFNYYDVDTDATPTGSFGYAFLGTRRATDGTTWQNFAAGDALSIEIFAVPEPSSFALVAFGAATVALGYRRRGRRAG